MDLPRIFTIRESSHRIHNPLTAAKLADLGSALQLDSGTRVLDLASGSGEMLCTWARDHKITGTGVDISTTFTEQARARAVELDVADKVEFIHGDASGHVAAEPVDLAACVGATWIGNGVAGTADLLNRSLRPGGLMLIGEPYWRTIPPDEETAQACHATSIADFLPLPRLIEQLQDLGYDVVEMMLADQDSWDRYVAAQWLNMRRWLDQTRDDELASEVREALTTEPAHHARATRRPVDPSASVECEIERLVRQSRTRTHTSVFHAPSRRRSTRESTVSMKSSGSVVAMSGAGEDLSRAAAWVPVSMSSVRACATWAARVHGAFGSLVPIRGSVASR